MFKAVGVLMLSYALLPAHAGDTTAANGVQQLPPATVIATKPLSLSQSQNSLDLLNAPAAELPYTLQLQGGTRINDLADSVPSMC